jgi:TRAP-type C4-dicarboxylate transport system permease small subunit
MLTKIYRGFLLGLELLIEHAATLLFILFFIAVLLQVFYRYVLSQPLTWSEEAARYLNIWAVLLAAALAVKRSEHLRVDLIDLWLARWPLRLRLGFHVLGTLLSALVVVTLLRGSYQMTLDRWSVMLTMIPLPQGVIYLALLVSSALMLLFFAHQLAGQLLSLARGGRAP